MGSRPLAAPTMMHSCRGWPFNSDMVGMTMADEVADELAAAIDERLHIVVDEDAVGIARGMELVVWCEMGGQCHARLGYPVGGDDDGQVLRLGIGEHTLEPCLLCAAPGVGDDGVEDDETDAL